MTFYSAYVVPVVTGIFLFGTLTWIGYLLCWWIPRYLGVGRFFLIRRIKEKYRKGFQYDDETIKLCQTAITRGWKLKEMVVLTKNSPHKDEIIYTYLMMMKIKKDWFDPKLYHEKPESNIKFLEDIVKKVK